MKKNRGITLISLTITVVILLILAGTITYSGIHVYENMLVENFISEMKLIQEKVNLTCERFELSEYTDLNTYLTEKGIISDKTDITKAGTLNEEVSAFVGENSEGYQYFDAELLEQNLGIKNLEHRVIINFNTREVISLKGVKKDDKTYYRQYDLSGGDKIVEYNNIQGGTANLINIEKYIYGLSARLKIYSISSDIKSIYYGEMIEKDEENNPIVSNWNEIGGISQQYEINLVKTGDYVVKAEDRHGNTDTQIVNITLVNSPDLSIELIPIKYDDNTKHWVIAKENDGTWYDYNNSGTAKWANAMLSDGRYKNKNGVYVDTKNTEDTSDDEELNLDNTQIILEEADMGSIFVWIPRYMYEIEQNKNEDGSYNTNTGCKKSQSGIINIKFLKGTTDIPTDDTLVKTSETLGDRNWIVHPSFKDGTINNFSNGEWNEEIKGIWVSKYEVSRSDATTVNIGESETLKVASKLKKLDNIPITDIYDKSINFNKNLNSHMMKNSEYGAIVYLSYSQYGTNMEKIDDIGTSTKNEYGIYNLNDELKEVVSAFNVKDDLDGTNIFNETNRGNKSTKYITINNIANANRRGDAVIETSENSESWNSIEISRYPDEQKPYMVRGISNIFNYNATDGQENLGFRIILINS